eukprot:jgi/Ulvmu1/8084/UM004_0321.1
MILITPNNGGPSVASVGFRASARPALLTGPSRCAFTRSNTIRSSPPPHQNAARRFRLSRTWAWGKPGSPAKSDAPSLKQRYPSVSPFRTGHLQVSDVHKVYFEQYGNPCGMPALFVHGGPGASCFQRHATFFNPELYNIILLDQRGCGKSTPSACVHENNTDELVADIEKIRTHLGVESWILLGGSWGVALALAYAIQHPARVLGMVLRGVCLMREQEIDWVFRGGCKALVPQAWEQYLAGLTEKEQEDPLAAYFRRLTHTDDNVRLSAAMHWSFLERSLNLSASDKLQVWRGDEWTGYELRGYTPVGPPVPALVSPEPAPQQQGPLQLKGLPPRKPFTGGPQYAATAQAILTCHYSLTNGSGRRGKDLDILSQIDTIRHIPTIAVHGRQDIVCPIKTAWDLHAAWPELELQVVPGSGHSMYEPAVSHCLVKATDRMAKLAAQLN